MANYPPPPPGGGFAPAPTPAADPYAPDRALAEWAQARGYGFSTAPDIRWYQAWYPFAYLFHITRLGREVRATFGDAAAPVGLWIAETFEGDALKEAAGEDRHVVAFLTSSRLAYRAAVRSRTGAGLVSDIGKELDSLFGSAKKTAGVLGDPTFESRFEVAVPTREEGVSALTVPLRQLLFQSQWRGILEVRAGGLVCAMHDRTGFDPATLDATIAFVGQLYQAAIAYPHPVTAPPHP
jgi:hypothetical protein